MFRRLRALASTDRGKFVLAAALAAVVGIIVLGRRSTAGAPRELGPDESFSTSALVGEDGSVTWPAGSPTYSGGYLHAGGYAEDADYTMGDSESILGSLSDIHDTLDTIAEQTKPKPGGKPPKPPAVPGYTWVWKNGKWVAQKKKPAKPTTKPKPKPKPKPTTRDIPMPPPVNTGSGGVVQPRPVVHADPAPVHTPPVAPPGAPPKRPAPKPGRVVKPSVRGR